MAQLAAEMTAPEFTEWQAFYVYEHQQSADAAAKQKQQRGR